MLGAVQAQRASAEEPEDDQRRREQSRRELEPARQRDEEERRQERAEQKEALARAGDAASAGERRHRRGQLHQAAQERDPGRRRAPARHRSLVQLAGVRRERPVVLADDHDAVRAGHAAEPRQRGCAVGVRENVGDAAVHLHIVDQKGRPASAGRPIPARGAAYLEAAATEKAEQCKHEHDDQDDPQQAHLAAPFVSGGG